MNTVSANKFDILRSDDENSERNFEEQNQSSPQTNKNIQ